MMGSDWLNGLWSVLFLKHTGVTHFFCSHFEKLVQDLACVLYRSHSKEHFVSAATCEQCSK
uniref:Uncharacterized protein n=1 Tax=Anguilla anguilla TaxID=7936 RepID=A0A0E9S926_ANGAN